MSTLRSDPHVTSPLESGPEASASSLSLDVTPGACVHPNTPVSSHNSCMSQMSVAGTHVGLTSYTHDSELGHASHMLHNAPYVTCHYIHISCMHDHYLCTHHLHFTILWPLHYRHYFLSTIHVTTTFVTGTHMTITHVMDYTITTLWWVYMIAIYVMVTYMITTCVVRYIVATL